MYGRELRRTVLTAAAVALLLAFTPGYAASEEQAQGAPQKVSAPGELVRMGFNDTGYVTLGYRIANESVGEEWLLLEVGMTLNKGVEEVEITRDSLSVETPDGSRLPLATQEQYNEAYKVMRPLDRKANRVRDNIDYLPASATNPCSMRFFTGTGGARRLSSDAFQLSWRTRCFGRLYFQVPGGIQYGQHFLHVQLGETTMRVPFRIMTKEELKEAKAEYKQKMKEAKQAE